MHNFVFDKIREKHTSLGATNSNVRDQCLNEIVKELQSNCDFVMGAFVQMKMEATKYKPDIVKISGERLFFSNIGTKEFKERAIKTLEKLETENLFISRLIYELDQRRTNMIELIHHCLCDKCCDSSKGEMTNISWLSIGQLGKIVSTLPESIDSAKKKELEQLENIYKGVVCGYFPDSENECYILVYCPFLVGDNKPPGNFFGVFRGCGYHHQPVDKSNPLLQLLNKVQIAGTLLFSQLSVAELLEIENNAKYQDVKKLLSDARKIRTEALAQMDKLYEKADALLDPFGLWAGVDPLQKWISLYEKSFVDEPLAEWGYGNAHNCSDWKPEGRLAFASKFKEFCEPLIKPLISDKLYNNLFYYWEESNIHELEDNISIGICMAKELSVKSFPLAWVEEILTAGSTFSKTKQVILENNVHPLVFVRSCQLLKEKIGLTFKIEQSEGSEKLVVSTSVTRDPTLDGLNVLKEKTVKKISDLVSGNRIKLTSGHDSSALAVLIFATNDSSKDLNSIISLNSGQLNFSGSIKIYDALS